MQDDVSGSDGIVDYLEQFNYALEWFEPILGHVTGRVWEANVDAGVYVIKRMHGTSVFGSFEPNELTCLPEDRSRSFTFWIEGADKFEKDKSGWLKAGEAEHMCRLWCEEHASRNKLIAAE